MERGGMGWGGEGGDGKKERGRNGREGRKRMNDHEKTEQERKTTKDYIAIDHVREGDIWRDPRRDYGE